MKDLKKEAQAQIEILESDIEASKQYTNLDSTLHKDKRHLGNTFSISTTGNKAVLLGDYIYNNATIFLERKYNKYIICK